MLLTMLAARRIRRRLSGLLLICLTSLPYANCALANDSASDVDGLGNIKKQIEEIKTSESIERRRFENDEQRIQDLEHQLRQLETQNQKLSGVAQNLTVTISKLQSDTDQRIASLQQQIASGISSTQFDSAFDRYLRNPSIHCSGRCRRQFYL